MAVAAVTAVTLMAVARRVAMVVREAAMAATRLVDLASSEDLAVTVARAAKWGRTRRLAALAARPVVPERAALAATLLADRAETAVGAATAGTLMAAARLVAMAVLEFC